MRLQVRKAGPEDATAWDQFVELHSSGSFFHLYDWHTVFERGLGHSTYYLLAEGAEGIEAVLPLVHTRSLLFGNTLSSLPFCTFAGTLASNPEARAVIEARAVEIGQELGVGAEIGRASCRERV